jgi:hypothetical protein
LFWRVTSGLSVRSIRCALVGPDIMAADISTRVLENSVCLTLHSEDDLTNSYPLAGDEAEDPLAAETTWSQPKEVHIKSEPADDQDLQGSHQWLIKRYNKFGEQVLNRNLLAFSYLYPTLASRLRRA